MISNDLIRDNPPYSYLSFRFGNVTYAFENNQIRRNKNVPIGATAKQGEFTLGYYVPLMELNSGSPLLHGRMFLAVTENGHLIDKKSSADNAICTITSYGK